MKNNLFNTLAVLKLKLVVPILVILCGSLAGCGESGKSEVTGGDSVQVELPKQTFHRPENFTLAVARLSEIVLALRSDFALPAPKKFKVLEVIHGTGSSAHSHYYLADSEHHDDHGHEDLESSEKLHDIEVDVYTELNDIVRWLPKIAGDGDMDKETWDQVNQLSKAFQDHLESVCDAKEGDELRDAIRSEAETIGEWIETLKKLAAELPPEESQLP